MAEEDSESGILVYVQAIPLEQAGPKRSFEEFFQDSEFEMSYSSKIALTTALKFSTSEITAVGFTPILHEALARGATKAVAVPFCDDALEQAKTLPRGSMILVGENPDGPFTGASLAGALAHLRGISIHLYEYDEGKKQNANKFTEGTVMLIKNGTVAEMDVRKIKQAVETRILIESPVGRLDVERTSREIRHELLSGSTGENVSAISRRLTRVAIYRGSSVDS